MVSAHGLGCEGFQITLTEDMGFIFEKGIGIKDFFTRNISEYCTEFVAPGTVPEFNMELPYHANQPRTYTWTCRVRDSRINHRLSSLFPLTVFARGCGQALNEHFEYTDKPPPAQCGATLRNSDNVFNIKISLFGEKVHILEGPRPPHSWVWFCDVQIRSSSVPLESGDVFVLDIVANSVDSITRRMPALALVVTAASVLVAAVVELRRGLW